MSVTYKNRNNGDEVTLDEKSARLERLDNWERVKGSADEGEGREPTEAEGRRLARNAPLDRLSREQLEERATAAGVEGAGELKNKGDLIEAIRKAEEAD